MPKTFEITKIKARLACKTRIETNWFSTLCWQSYRSMVAIVLEYHCKKRWLVEIVWVSLTLRSSNMHYTSKGVCPVGLSFFFELCRKKVIQFKKHRDLLASVVFCNSCDTAWFWQHVTQSLQSSLTHWWYYGRRVSPKGG